MSVTTFSKTITIKRQDGTIVTSGTLAVTETTGPPPTTTGTLTPANLPPPAPASTSIDCGTIVWTATANGTVNFGFQLDAADGDFPIGTYRFNGTQTANGNPSGTVVWPSGADPDSGGVEDDTWQASG